MFHAAPMVNSLDDFVFDEKGFETYLETWLEGIRSEIIFWKHFIDTKGSEWETNWDDLISNDRKFALDTHLETTNTKFLDAGSGPFSSWGIKSEKSNLRVTAVDPLAFAYQMLKSEAGITTGITPEYAMVERLHEKFDENTFDIVHMRNSLDHSFNPLVGIIQLLFVCKVNGKILLQHARNEAENENYVGFHQWNLCGDGTDFIIWRKGIAYNVSKMLGKYADVVVDDRPDKNWIAVIMRKKADVPLFDVQSNIVSMLDTKIFQKLSALIVSDIFINGEGSFTYLKRIIRKVPLLRNILRSIYRAYLKQKNRRSR